MLFAGTLNFLGLRFTRYMAPLRPLCCPFTVRLCPVSGRAINILVFTSDAIS